MKYHLTAIKIKNKMKHKLVQAYMVHMLKLRSETATVCIPSGEGLRLGFKPSNICMGYSFT